MGYKIFDQYSLLHFASGVICYFYGIKFSTSVMLHTLFEIVENTKLGMHIINTYLTFWPGGKPKADSFINSIIGDNLSFALGWLAASTLDKMGKKYSWYST